MSNKYEIMYIESKEGCIASLAAHIGKVSLSKTGKTIRYRGQEFQSLKGHGYKANYFNVESGEWYWISGCRKDGNDGLYRTTVHVDSDIRQKYWCEIRQRPERQEQDKFVSVGKHKPNGQEPKNNRNNV